MALQTIMYRPNNYENVNTMRQAYFFLIHLIIIYFRERESFYSYSCAISVHTSRNYTHFIFVCIS